MNKRIWRGWHKLVIIGLLLTVAPTHGEEIGKRPVTVPPDPKQQGMIVGANAFYEIKAEDNLIELAPLRGLGYTNLKNANPKIDPWLPRTGQTVLLPFAAILPLESSPGITINLAELRLFHVRRDGDRYLVDIYPIGIGTDEAETPMGAYRIMNKVEDPVWTPPPTVRSERPNLPATVPPGPRNPLGKFWMQFSPAGYGIHGTNKPMGVGRRVSHGCIRLYAQDIRDLFAVTAVGTPVRIINTPVKVGKTDSVLFLEVHRDFNENDRALRREIVRQAQALNWVGILDWDGINRALEENLGVPWPISLAEPESYAKIP